MSPELLYPRNLKFRAYYGFGLDAAADASAAAAAAAATARQGNCDTNARIKFIFDTAIGDLEWKNPTDFGENRKAKMAANGHYVKI